MLIGNLMKLKDCLHSFHISKYFKNKTSVVKDPTVTQY